MLLHLPFQLPDQIGVNPDSAPNLPALQPIGQLAVMSRVGKHSRIEDGYVFALGSSHRLHQQTGVAFTVNPRSHRLAKRVVRKMQKVRVFSSVDFRKSSSAAMHATKYTLRSAITVIRSKHASRSKPRYQ